MQLWEDYAAWLGSFSKNTVLKFLYSNIVVFLYPARNGFSLQSRKWCKEE